MRSAGDMDKYITEPVAVIGGGAAWLISRVLRSPAVAKVLANAPSGLDRADIAATVTAIHAAGRAYENRLDRERRDNADRPGAVVPQSWTTEQTATYLGLSLRRTQELAPELDGRRIGGRWLIPAVAVQSYEQQKAERTA
jgi:hypothetical protein